MNKPVKSVRTIIIHKQTIDFDSQLENPVIFQLPIDSKIISVANQNDKIVFWYMFLTEQQEVLEFRKLLILGTGWNVTIDSELNFLNSIQMSNGLVWHVFEILS